MSSTVFLMRFQHKDPLDQTKNRLKKLFKTAGFDKLVEKQDITAVKVHFGEQGNSTYVSHHYIEPVVRMIKSCGAKPFVTDTNVLYKSRRDNAIDHLALAAEHGFTEKTVGAPIIIADGILGRNETEIEINAPLNQTISLATELVSAHSAIVISHATGHLATGLGATIKNLGMGMSSRKGKLTQHSVSKPIISETKCTACGVCAAWCPADAITVGDDFAVIDDNICIGCGECLAVCRFNAVKFKWDSSSELLQKQIAEHALGIVKQKKGKMGYFTFLINMTRDCDCLAQEPISIMDDIGVMAGTDPVAIDQAVYDLTSQASGKSLSQIAFPALDATIQLKYGEEIGLGNRDYTLVETDF
ncbi:MAG: DUF362 domain-containing protein [Candidatus Marinimicrobia bacterium]|nr:DUF362 domain-containing protein [Candidatus Neomarinimicrobiota bacterium]RKY60992.1 MAG: 4Fe-4S ferredoxin [Candidatus Neomarinimicrobiota bacterium]